MTVNCKFWWKLDVIPKVQSCVSVENIKNIFSRKVTRLCPFLVHAASLRFGILKGITIIIIIIIIIG